MQSHLTIYTGCFNFNIINKDALKIQSINFLELQKHLDNILERDEFIKLKDHYRLKEASIKFTPSSKFIQNSNQYLNELNCIQWKERIFFENP